MYVVSQKQNRKEKEDETEQKQTYNDVFKAASSISLEWNSASVADVPG